MQELFLLNPRLADFPGVIIYGPGQVGRGIFLKLLQRNIKVECFADTSPENCGARVFNIPVCHIRELRGKTDRAIIVGGRYTFEVADELEKMGFVHIFYDFGNEGSMIHLEREDRDAD